MMLNESAFNRDYHMKYINSALRDASIAIEHLKAPQKKKKKSKLSCCFSYSFGVSPRAGGLGAGPGCALFDCQCELEAADLHVDGNGQRNELEGPQSLPTLMLFE